MIHVEGKAPQPSSGVHDWLNIGGIPEQQPVALSTSSNGHNQQLWFSLLGVPSYMGTAGLLFIWVHMQNISPVIVAFMQHSQQTLLTTSIDNDEYWSLLTNENCYSWPSSLRFIYYQPLRSGKIIPVIDGSPLGSTHLANHDTDVPL